MTFRLCKKRFDKKPKVNFKFYDATDWTTNKCNIYIYIHIQPNISRRKGNQAMRLGQVIEYSIKILFLGNHVQNTVKKLISVPFKKN